jgi:hypothetical protein
MSQVQIPQDLKKVVSSPSLMTALSLTNGFGKNLGRYYSRESPDITFPKSRRILLRAGV